MEEDYLQWRNHFIIVPKVHSLGMVSPSKTQQQQQQPPPQQQQQQHEERQQQPSRENIKWDKGLNLRIQRGPKPLEKKSFYLDIKNQTAAAKLETRIKDLGGSIQVFLVRGVSLVASDRIDKTGYVNSEKRKWAFTSGGSGGFPSLRSIEVPTPIQTPPTPFFSSECPLSNSTNLRGSTAQRSKSRVDAMLERALIQPQQYSVDPLDNAQAWGIPIWAVEKLESWLDKISASIKDSQRSQCKKDLDGKQNSCAKDTKIRQLKGPFLKFESYHRNTRAVFFEFPTWPKLNLSGEPGFCPFDTKKREALDCCKATTKRRDVKENRREVVLDLTSRGQQKDMTRRQRATATRARRTEHLTSGYCEICRTEYRDLSKHVQSDQHLTFVRNDDNFLSLDRLINAGANVEAFLKLNHTQNIERDCTRFPEDERRLDRIVAESKGMRDTKSLDNNYTVSREIKMVQCNGTRRNVESKLSGQSHNLRTRMKHESGHLLRSKGSPWHELEKSDKFYDKFEGFTVKKRAKGTIWIEEEEHPDTNTFLQAESPNVFANLKQDAYSIGNLRLKSEPACDQVGGGEGGGLPDARTYARKKDEALVVTPVKSIIRPRDNVHLDNSRLDGRLDGRLDSRLGGRQQGQETENGRLTARVNGGVTAAEANQCVYEYTRARNCKSLTPEAASPVLAVTADNLPRLQAQDAHLHHHHLHHHHHHHHHHHRPHQTHQTHHHHHHQQQVQQPSPVHGSILSNGCANVKHPSNSEIEQGLESEKNNSKVSIGEKERRPGDNKDVDGKARVTMNEECAERNKERQQAQRNGGKSTKWSRRGGRNGTRARHRLSVEERLIEDNRAYYKVEVLGSKLRSSVLPSGTSTVTCSFLPEDPVDDQKKKGEGADEAPSSEKPVVVRFKRVRKSELSLLSDEAESFMFGERDKRDNSSGSSDDEQSSVLPRDTEQSECLDSAASSVFPSSVSDAGSAASAASAPGNPNISSAALSSSSPAKSEAAMNEDDSQDSLGSLGRARKRRRTQAEALIKDNTDYYKFETPGSRLRYQGSLADLKCREHEIIASPGAAVDAAAAAPAGGGELSNAGEEAIKKMPTLAGPGKEALVEPLEKVYPSKPSAEVEKLQFSFEAVPRSEPWYQTYQRQDQGAEYWHYFSESDIRKPFLLPYEIENFHEILSRCQSRVDIKRKGRGGRIVGSGGRSPRKSPRCHASTLAIMSTIIRKKEQQQQQQSQHHSHVSSSLLYTIDENESISGSSLSNSGPAFNDIRAKSEAIGELREMARTIDEMLDAKDAPDVFESVGIEAEAAGPYSEVNLYGGPGIPRGPPPNLLELLDNCHDLVNCLENSSCASSECGEGNSESPLKRRKKRKNRTGWPGIKLKRKLQHNKSPSEIEGEPDNQRERDTGLKNLQQCNSDNSAETLPILNTMKLTASDFSSAFPQRTLSSSSNRDFPLARIPQIGLKTDNELQQQPQQRAHATDGPSPKGPVEVRAQTKSEDKGDDQEVGPGFPTVAITATTISPGSASPPSPPLLCLDTNEESETRHQSQSKTETTTTASCEQEASSSICVRSTGCTALEMREGGGGGGGGPLTERDAAPSKEYNVHRNGADVKAVAEVPQYELGNDENHENHENHENQQRRPPSKLPMRKRQRDTTSSSEAHEMIHQELEKCEASDREQGTVHAGSTTLQECEIERHTGVGPGTGAVAGAGVGHGAAVGAGAVVGAGVGGGAVHKRSNRVASRKRKIHSPRKGARRDSIRCAAESVFENENCKKDSYLSSMGYGKQQQLANTKISKQPSSEVVTSTVQETEIDTPLSERIGTRLVSSSELEQRRSSIDFQPVVRMMKIDEQVDVDHGILSVTVASNRRLRSSSSPRSSNPPPKKRLKSSVNRGQFGRLLKGS